jgi:hypothetical protein
MNGVVPSGKKQTYAPSITESAGGSSFENRQYKDPWPNEMVVIRSGRARVPSGTMISK